MLKHTVLAEAHAQNCHAKAEVQALKQALTLSEHACNEWAFNGTCPVTTNSFCAH